MAHMAHRYLLQVGNPTLCHVLLISSLEKRDHYPMPVDKVVSENQQPDVYLIRLIYPPVIKRGRWKTPQISGGFHGKIINGEFSSQPCLITGGYPT